MPTLTLRRRDPWWGLEGPLSFLFNAYDGKVPFSSLLAEARARGYTEPDPRADLSGRDVARKLLGRRGTPVIVCLVAIGHTAMRGQVNLQILLLLCAWIACSLGRSRPIGGLCLAVAA